MKRIELITPSISSGMDADDFWDEVYDGNAAADYIEMEFAKDTVRIGQPTLVSSSYDIEDWGSQTIKLKPEMISKLKSAWKKDKQRLAQEIVEKHLMQMDKERSIGRRTKRII